MRRFVGVAAALALLAPTAARANGRFPFANHLVVAERDPKHLLLRTTYGVLQSFDAGATWRWICETAVGYGGTLDPAVALAGDGRLLAGLFGKGIATSADRGCTFTSDAAPFTGQYVIDLAVEPGAPGRVVAISATGSAAGTFTVRVAQSLDGGATFAKVGADLPPTFNAETIEVVKGKPGRLYASGSREGSAGDAGADAATGRVGLLYRSDDGGASWKELVVDLRGGTAVFVSAVDPRDPDRLYARVAGDPKIGGPDRLLFSKDAGETFVELAVAKGSMLGLALHPDGTRIAWGGPTDGVWVASTSDHTFSRRSGVGARCLTWAAAGLYACGADFPDGFTLGLSKDDGATFAPLYKLAQLGPLECPAGTTTATTCPREWPATKDKLGILDPDAGPVDAGAGDAGPATPPPDDGCGCHVGAAPRAALGSGLLALALGLLRARRAQGRSRGERKRTPSKSSA